tara:strand:- start:62 stop:910 length:849 start_codon:yes stop_codon:yes gene_type:complete
MKNKPFKSKIFLIAEIGINHNGDINIAKELISMAKSCDYDAVKFQKRDIETVYSDEILSQKRESPWGTTQREQKLGLEFSEKEYDIIDNFCKEKEIEWFASPWDLKSLEFLKKYKTNYNKVASVMLTHYELLNKIADEKKFTFISTGMSTEDEIDKAVNIFVKKNCPYSILHCNSTYPCPLDEINLSYMLKLKEKYNCIVGYSGHESSVSPSFAAAVLGAEVIERHITLDRAMYGSDQAASLSFDGMKDLSNQVRSLEKIMGDGKKVITSSEKKVRDKLKYW